MRTTGVKGGSNPAHPSNPNLQELYASIRPHILGHCPYRRGPRAGRGSGRIRLDCSRLVRDFPGTFYRIARFSWRPSATGLAQNPNLRSADYADYTVQRSRNPAEEETTANEGQLFVSIRVHSRLIRILPSSFTRPPSSLFPFTSARRFRPLRCEFACKLGESGACRAVAREERAGESG